ncbi:Hypothetical predicted protein, partial [Olea europaea subsp. europaea]
RVRKAEGQYLNIKLLHKLVDKKALTQGDVCAILKEDYSSLPSHLGRKVKWQGKPYRLLEKNRSHPNMGNGATPLKLRNDRLVKLYAHG